MSVAQLQKHLIGRNTVLSEKNFGVTGASVTEMDQIFPQIYMTDYIKKITI